MATYRVILHTPVYLCKSENVLPETKSARDSFATHKMKFYDGMF